MLKQASTLIILMLLSIGSSQADTLFVLNTNNNGDTQCPGSNNTALASAKSQILNRIQQLRSAATVTVSRLTVLMNNNTFKTISTASNYKLRRFLKTVASDGDNKLAQLLSQLSRKTALTDNVSDLVIYSTDQSAALISSSKLLRTFDSIKNIEINLYADSQTESLSLNLHNKTVQINFFSCPDNNGWQRYKTDIYLSLAKQLGTKTGLNVNNIYSHTEFERDLGMDTLSAFQFQARSTNQYSVSIPKSEHMTRLSDLVTYIAKEQLKQKLVDKNGDSIKFRSTPQQAADTAYLQTIYYATNRKPSTEDGLHFNGLRQLGSNNINYGICRVAIPKSHKPGKTSSALLDMKLFNDPKEHIHIRELKSLSEDHFYKSINALLNQETVAKSMANDMVIFIHGFNVPFNQAVRRTAQIAYDTNFKGIPMLFSWPSDGELTGYMSDREDATWSVQHMEKFLDDIIKKTRTRKIHLIAHSMGNQVLIGALNRIALKRKPSAESLFGNIIFAAPDFDAELFKHQIASQVVTLADTMTIYTSKKDTALTLSTKVNKAQRLGLTITKLDNINLIDASNIEVSPWSVPSFHSYYATKEKVIDDIVATLHGVPPENRKLVAANKDDFKYWLIKN